jgi:hypothetical protein
MGYIFNKDGKDKYGGYYDEEFNYHPGQEYLDLVQAIHDEHDLLEKYGQDEGEEDREEDQYCEGQDFDDYLQKEKINPTLDYIKDNADKRWIFISFKGMSNKTEDVKAYSDWFKEREVKPIDIAINASRLNVRISTSDVESIINAIKLEGTPDVDIIKVYLPFLSSEKVGVEDDEDDAVDDNQYIEQQQEYDENGDLLYPEETEYPEELQYDEDLQNLEEPEEPKEPNDLTETPKEPVKLEVEPEESKEEPPKIEDKKKADDDGADFDTEGVN